MTHSRYGTTRADITVGRPPAIEVLETPVHPSRHPRRPVPSAGGPVMRRTSAGRGGRRTGVTMVQAAVTITLIVALGAWMLPQLTGSDTIAQDRLAQAQVELAIDAALAVRRDTGAFTTDVETHRRYLAGATPRSATTDTLEVEQISLFVSDDGPQAQVTAAAVTPDGTCWALRRSFPPAEFETLYLARPGPPPAGQPCNAALAATMTASDIDDPARGSSFAAPGIIPPATTTGG